MLCGARAGPVGQGQAVHGGEATLRLVLPCWNTLECVTLPKLHMCFQPTGFPLGTSAHGDVTGPAGSHRPKEVGHSVHTTEVVPRVQSALAPHSFPRMDSCCAAGHSQAWFSHRNSLQLLTSSLVENPVPLLQQTRPCPSAAIAGRKFRDCSSGESSVSKQSSFQNGTKQRQSFACELEFNDFESLNSAQLDKIKMFCPDFNYPLLLNYFIYITVYYAQAF